MVTVGYNMESRRDFLLNCLPILQLAFAEYLYNFIQDYMPVESKILGIEGTVSTGKLYDLLVILGKNFVSVHTIPNGHYGLTWVHMDRLRDSLRPIQREMYP